MRIHIQYLSDSKDVLLENIYNVDGERFDFNNGESKWYQLIEFLSQEVYTLDKRKFGPYFEVSKNIDGVIESLTPKVSVGYGIIILSDDNSDKYPICFVYPCKTERENVISIVYSEDEFMEIYEEHRLSK